MERIIKIILLFYIMYIPAFINILHFYYIKLSVINDLRVNVYVYLREYIKKYKICWHLQTLK